MSIFLPSAMSTLINPVNPTFELFSLVITAYLDQGLSEGLSVSKKAVSLGTIPGISSRNALSSSLVKFNAMEKA